MQKAYVVIYTMPGDTTERLFVCDSVDEEHAGRQTQDAFPGAEIVSATDADVWAAQDPPPES